MEISSAWTDSERKEVISALCKKYFDAANPNPTLLQLPSQLINANSALITIREVSTYSTEFLETYREHILRDLRN